LRSGAKKAAKECVFGEMNVVAEEAQAAGRMGGNGPPEQAEERTHGQESPGRQDTQRWPSGEMPPPGDSALDPFVTRFSTRSSWTRVDVGLWGTARLTWPTITDYFRVMSEVPTNSVLPFGPAELANDGRQLAPWTVPGND
jgi:hypothetical protein